jgi:ankyrin repeat protein
MLKILKVDTPLIWTAKKGLSAYAAQILFEYDVDIDARNNDGMTDLHWAAKECCLYITGLLLKHNIKDKDEFSSVRGRSRNKKSKGI